MLDRLVDRVLLPRLVPRAQQVLDRLVLVARGEPMVREQSVDLFLVAGIPFFQPPGRAAMQARAVRGEHASVRALLDQRVLEAVLRLRPAPFLTDEVEPLEIVQGLPRRAVAARNALEERHAEVSPEH